MNYSITGSEEHIHYNVHCLANTKRPLECCYMCSIFVGNAIKDSNLLDFNDTLLRSTRLSESKHSSSTLGICSLVAFIFSSNSDMMHLLRHVECLSTIESSIMLSMTQMGMVEYEDDAGPYR